MSYKLIATRIWQVFTSHSTTKQIERTAENIFEFEKKSFPQGSITSSKAGLIYDWIMTLANRSMDNESRDQLLIKFCKALTTGEETEREVIKILSESDLASNFY